MSDETVLCTALAARADCYARALVLADELASGITLVPQEANGDDRLGRLLALLDEAAGHEARVAAVRQRWEQAGTAAGAELIAARDRVAAMLEQLGRLLQTIEEAARTRRDRLAVELDACNRRRQMQRAYLGGP